MIIIIIGSVNRFSFFYFLVFFEFYFSDFVNGVKMMCQKSCIQNSFWKKKKKRSTFCQTGDIYRTNDNVRCTNGDETQRDFTARFAIESIGGPNCNKTSEIAKFLLQWIFAFTSIASKMIWIWMFLSVSMDAWYSAISSSMNTHTHTHRIQRK